MRNTSLVAEYQGLVLHRGVKLEQSLGNCLIKLFKKGNGKSLQC